MIGRLRSRVLRQVRGEARTGLLLVIIGLCGLALRFWNLDALGLVGDESYYWLWSRSPAVAYFDNPGGTAWMVMLSTWLGGQTEVGVRWLNALLGTLCAPLIYVLARRLYSSAAGLMAAAIVALGAPFIITSRLVYTDSLAFILLLTNLYLLWPIIAAPQGTKVTLSTRRWAGIGITWALLANTKLSVYPFWGALGLGILLWRRDLLRERNLWLAALGVVLGLVPFWAWNAAYDFAGAAWDWQQFTTKTVPAPSTLSALYHAVMYLTPPLVIILLTGLSAGRGSTGRWLLLIALFLGLPVLISRANSPRNLLLGCLPLAILAGIWLTTPGRWLRGRAIALTLLLASTALYGFGTAWALVDESPLPQSSVARAIREDAAGWRALGPQLGQERGLLFCVDYSTASQVWYYSRRPTYSHWGHYELVLGIPDFTEATVISLDFVPPSQVDNQVRRAFAQVEGPLTIEVSERGASKRVHLWRGKGLSVSKNEFLQMLDFFTLYWAYKPPY